MAQDISPKSALPKYYMDKGYKSTHQLLPPKVYQSKTSYSKGGKSDRKSSTKLLVHSRHLINKRKTFLAQNLKSINVPSLVDYNISLPYDHQQNWKDSLNFQGLCEEKERK